MSDAASIRKPESLLTDGVIRFVPLDQRYADDFDELGRDPEVARFTYAPVPFTRDDAVAWIARYERGWAAGSMAGFAVEDVDTGAFVGFACVVRFSGPGREAELGYMVGPAWRGRGIAVRTLRLLSEWAVREVGAIRLELRIAVDNAGSLAVAERAGYRREGVLRSLHFKAGERVDAAVYSLLADELPRD